MKKLTLICMAIIATMSFASCRGPQGPAGNANVASSPVTASSRDWKWENGSWCLTIDYNAISQNIDDFGAVLVYMYDQNAWRQIPMTYYYSEMIDGEERFFSSSLEVATQPGKVYIYWTENDFTDIGAPGTHDFKIVAIAANIYANRQDVDYSNYEAVKTVFQLAD